VVGTIATSPFATFGQSAGAASLKIGTIGAGREGGALGTLFAKQGHAVMFSSRHPEALKDLVAAAGPTAQAGTVEQAVAFADVVVIAVPYSAMEQVGKDYGKALATKQLILDISNPNASRDGEIVKWVEEQGGAGLATAKLLPGAPIVRAFNAIDPAGWHPMRIAPETWLRCRLRRRHEGDRAGVQPDQGGRVRAGARRRPRHGQVPGAGNPPCRRAYGRRGPADRRHLEVIGEAVCVD